MKLKLSIILLSLFLLGCEKPSNITPVQSGGVVVTKLRDAKIGDFAIDNFGFKYKKIKDASKADNGATNCELWEKVDPVDPQHYFTPSLSNKIDPSSKPTFDSLMRLPGQ